jgi:hypothetical protein
MVGRILDGALGTVAGTAFLAAEAGPVPTSLVAKTVTVYSVPFERPVITQLRASPLCGAQEVDAPVAGDAVTVYPVIGTPPVSTGAFHAMLKLPFSGSTLVTTAALGAERGVLFTPEDFKELPATLVAKTVTF